MGAKGAGDNVWNTAEGGGEGGKGEKGCRGAAIMAIEKKKAAQWACE